MPNECFDGQCIPNSKYVCRSCPLLPKQKGDDYLQEMNLLMTYPKMTVFQVTNGTTPLKVFKRNGFKRFLASAYSAYFQHGCGKRTVEELSECEWILDSGMISAWKNGIYPWMDCQSLIIELAIKLNPSYVASLDIPMEPNLLEKNDMTREKALSKTISNSLAFVEAEVGKSTKIFTLQGWDVDEYLYCLDEFERYDILSYIKKTNSWIGIGTMCMRSPENHLYEIAELFRNILPNYHIHIWGVGQLKYQKRLSEIGIDSTDTASVLMEWAFNQRKSSKMSKI